MKKYRFTGKIEAAPGGGAYVFFPYDIEKEFGAKGKVPVKATFDGVPYTGSLARYGHGQHVLGCSNPYANRSAKVWATPSRSSFGETKRQGRLKCPPRSRS